MSSLELGTCGGQDCILKCTCGTGWSDTGSGAYIKRTSKNAYAFTGGASSRAASSTPQHKTCYKSVSCSDYFSGYTSGANVSSGHYGYTATQTTNGDTLYCHKDVGTCTYSCPSDYYTSATDGYKLTSTSKNKELVKSSTYSYNCSATNTIKCYTQIAKTCADYHTDGQLSDTKDGWKSPSNESVKLGASTKTCYYGFIAKTCADYHTDGQLSGTKDGWKSPSNESVKLGDSTKTCYYGFTAKTCADYGYKASIPSGQTCTAVAKKLGASTGTCYKDCKDDYFTVTFVMTWSGCKGTTSNGGSYDNDRYSNDPNASNPACGAISAVVGGAAVSSSGTRYTVSAAKGATVDWSVNSYPDGDGMGGQCGQLDTSGWWQEGPNVYTRTETVNSNMTLYANFKCGSSSGGGSDNIPARASCEKNCYRNGSKYAICIQITGNRGSNVTYSCGGTGMNTLRDTVTIPSTSDQYWVTDGLNGTMGSNVVCSCSASY